MFTIFTVWRDSDCGHSPHTSELQGIKAPGDVIRLCHSFMANSQH